MTAHIATGRPHRSPLPAALALIVSGPLLVGACLAGQLTYVPVNPSFGGNPLNGAYLLQSAQAQKRYPYPMDDLGLEGSGDYKILNAGNAPIIQAGDSIYIYDSTRGQWVPFDPDQGPPDPPDSPEESIAPPAAAPSAANIDSGVLR